MHKIDVQLRNANTWLRIEMFSSEAG